MGPVDALCSRFRIRARTVPARPGSARGTGGVPPLRPARLRPAPLRPARASGSAAFRRRTPPRPGARRRITLPVAVPLPPARSVPSSREGDDGKEADLLPG